MLECFYVRIFKASPSPGQMRKILRRDNHLIWGFGYALTTGAEEVVISVRDEHFPTVEALNAAYDAVPQKKKDVEDVEEEDDDY